MAGGKGGKGTGKAVLSAPGVGLYPPEGALSRDDESALVRSVAAAIDSEWRTACGALVRIGQLVIDACYAGDPRAALEDARGARGRFAAVVRRLDSMGTAIGEGRLSVARRIVAWNHLIRSPHWDRLDDGHKEALLPLDSREELVAGSRWALETQATRDELEGWVRERRKEQGGGAKPRGVRWQSVVGSLGRLEQAVTPESLARIGREFGKLAAADQRAARERLRRMRGVLERLEKHLGT